MQFNELRQIIKVEANKNNNFQMASNYIEQIIFALDKKDFIPLISQIGSIPEDIEHDSTEEKLYTKVSDIVLAKCFIELGLKAEVMRERANCADVIAKSIYHNYSLVGDAKAFRLSRTAKNQKDFKVESMVHWKCDNDYSVLCCPYFQYPKNKSQIYGQAIHGNVSLFSWEYFSILLKENIFESETFNLSNLWNFSSSLAKITSIENMNLCFLNQQDDFIKSLLKYSDEEFITVFRTFKDSIIARGNDEIKYWKNEIKLIEQYSKEKAIAMLIKSLKLNEKINAINIYISQLRG